MFAKSKPKHSYSILCVNKLKPPITPEKAARVILEHLDLDTESYRFGNTKVLIHHIVVQTARSLHFCLLFRLLFRVTNPNPTKKNIK